MKTKKKNPNLEGMYVILTKDLIEFLNNVSSEKSISKSAIIRSLIEAYRKQYIKEI